MASRGRKILPEVTKIYSNYIHNFAQRLKKEDALKMLQAEFTLEPDQAQLIFDIFDTDHNDILSIWEFQQFYTMIGHNVHNLFNQFKQMEVNGTGTADIEKVWETLKTLQCATGEVMQEKDLETFIKSTAGESKTIDLSKFLHLYCRIKHWKYRD